MWQQDDDDATVDAKITEALGLPAESQWAALWDAVDALDDETTFATWTGGDVVGTTIVDGEERPLHAVPYPIYTESVEQVRAALGALGLFVPFDWMSWDGLHRYRDQPTLLTDAPVTDAIRLLTAI